MKTAEKKTTETEKAWLASSDADFEKLGLKKGTVEAWEDGARTDAGRNSYEWWYFDGKLDDGATLVVAFYTKMLTDVEKPCKPQIMVTIDYTDGSRIEKQVEYTAEDFSSATDKCDVKIGANYFRGDLENYEIHFEDDELNLTIALTRETESWRPETGYMYFGEEGDYFAWVVAVPQGTAKVNYTYQGTEHNNTASCYHDHNWGNKSLVGMINHWYWQRADMGPYTIIAAEIIAEEKYGYSSIVVYNVSKNGKLMKDDESKVKLYRTYGIPDETTGKPVSKEIIFIYEDDTSRYDLKLTIEKHLLDTFLIQKKAEQKLVKLLTGFDGAYSRFSGTADFRVFENGDQTETYADDAAVWELMYFGN